MRFLTAILLVFLLSCPAWAGFKGPSVTMSPLNTARAAGVAQEGATCVLTGNITEHLVNDRYTFKDASGVLSVDIPPYVFGFMEVRPGDTVKITGEIRGIADPTRRDFHLRVRYIEKAE